MNKGLKSTKSTLQRIDQTTYVTFCYMFSHCVIYVEAEERRKHGFSVDSALHILVTHVGFPGEIQEDSLTLLLLFREEKSIAEQQDFVEEEAREKKTSIILCLCPPELHTITFTIP